jgi:hypothetical protein
VGLISPKNDTAKLNNPEDKNGIFSERFRSGISGLPSSG